MQGTSDCDVVVIGSGSGGLTAALALARAGRRVVVCEQHYLPGGYSQSFSLRGFQFSPGIHYVGALGPGAMLRRIYEGLGVANDLVFLEINPDGYDKVIVGRERFDIPKGRERFRERLRARFPGEAEGIDRYFDVIGRILDEIGQAAPVHTLTDAARMAAHMPTAIRYGMLPLSRFLDTCTSHPFLRAVLSIQSGDHGMAPSRAPTALHAGLQGYYFDGGCYPRGGGHAIPDTFVRHIRQHGGEVRLRTEVAEILVERGRALGVRLADGQELRAGVVISNADPGVTWGRLVAPEHQGWRLRRRIQRLKYSISTLSLFMAVDMDLRAAGLDSGNIWFSRTPDIDAVYALARRRRLTGHALAAASMDAFAAWRDLAPGHRPEAYRRLKDALTERLLDAVECFAPGLRDRTVFRALGTPLTNAHFLHATRGGIYGTEKTLGNLGPFSFDVTTHIDGLFQCGASTLAPGINGVTNSGLNAAAAVLGCDRDALLTATGQALRIYPSEHPEAWPVELRTSGRGRRAASG